MFVTRMPRGRAACALFGWLLAGCPTASTPSEAGEDLGRANADLGCYASPRTHVELLNACTSAQSVDKRPLLPLLRSDGSLPPLP